MSVERALEAYKAERLNCAQSILRAFQPERSIPEEDIVQAKRFGGGRAEAGLCGALHSALRLVEGEAARASIRENFIAAAGADTCREIRRISRIPCSECVRLAAVLLAGPSDGAAGKDATP